MATSSFKLRVNPSGSCKIYLHFNYGRKQVYRYATKFNINRKAHWIKSKQRVKVVHEEPNAEKINEELVQLDKLTETLIRQYQNHPKYLDNQIIKEDLESLIKNTSSDYSKNPSLISYFDWFLTYYENNPRPKINKPYKRGTLRSLKNTRNLLDRFQESYGSIHFNKIDLNFHEKFLKYMSDLNYSNNYKGTIIKNLKTVLNDAYEREFHDNLSFKKSGFIKPKENINHIYLTESEIERIEKVNMNILLDNLKGYFDQKNIKTPSKNILDRTRDIFLIGCYTGLRIDDLLSLSKNNIYEIQTTSGEKIKIIRVKTEKNDRIVEIPIKPQLIKILEKYNYDFPKKVTAQKVNYYIKAIGKAAEILIADNGINKPKYEQITAHTARRSFCTNAYKNGMHTLDIMSISGHKSEKVFLNYIKATPRDRLNQIKDHPFFK